MDGNADFGPVDGGRGRNDRRFWVRLAGRQGFLVWFEGDRRGESPKLRVGRHRWLRVMLRTEGRSHRLGSVGWN